MGSAYVIGSVGAKYRMKPVRTATFDGKKYEVIIQELDGLVSGRGDRVISVNRDPNTKIGLETIIHETLHSCSWSKSEKVVTRTACDIARFLWRLGYRYTQSN